MANREESVMTRDDVIEAILEAILEGVMSDPSFQNKVTNVQQSGASSSRISHGGKSYSVRTRGNVSTVKRRYLGGLIKRKEGSATFIPNR